MLTGRPAQRWQGGLQQHAFHVTAYAVALASMLPEVATGDLRAIRDAAFLHDIGKLAVAREIIEKPGPLDADERANLALHPEYGEAIIRRGHTTPYWSEEARVAFIDWIAATVDDPSPDKGQVARIVRHHHERWDGTGYPDRLAGDAIPLGSLVIAAADAFDAMTAPRPYNHGGMASWDAIGKIVAGQGAQFSPHLPIARVSLAWHSICIAEVR